MYSVFSYIEEWFVAQRSKPFVIENKINIVIVKCDKNAQFSSTERCKSYECLFFTENVGRNIDKNISKNLSGKYSQKLLDHDKQSAADALKFTLKRVIQETAEGTVDLIGNEIANRITKVSISSLQNNSKTIKK